MEKIKLIIGDDTELLGFVLSNSKNYTNMESCFMGVLQDFTDIITHKVETQLKEHYDKVIKELKAKEVNVIKQKGSR